MKTAQKRLDEKVAAMIAAKDFSYQVLGVLHNEVCDECGAKHGDPIPSGGKVILSVVGRRLLCYKHGIAHLTKITAKPSIRVRKDVLAPFGLRQEELI